MFGAVRIYQGVDPAGADEIARKAREGLIPLLSQQPGFIAYHLVSAGNGSWATISLFEDRAGAEASTHSATEWVRANLAELVKGAPTVYTGEVVASSSS